MKHLQNWQQINAAAAADKSQAIYKLINKYNSSCRVWFNKKTLVDSHLPFCFARKTNTDSKI